jgi:hypothetical protein
MNRRFCWGNLKEREGLEDLDIGGRITLISVSHYRMGPRGVEPSGSGWDNWANVFNTVINLGGSINCREFLEELSNY